MDPVAIPALIIGLIIFAAVSLKKKIDALRRKKNRDQNRV